MGIILDGGIVGELTVDSIHEMTVLLKLRAQRPLHVRVAKFNGERCLAFFGDQ